jgi:hypothetical protein
MIASVVMLIVLLSGLVTASSANTAIRDQYYMKVAQQAAEAGGAMAEACLKRNGYTPSWSTNPLRPNTDCNGTQLAGFTCPVPNETTPTPNEPRCAVVETAPLRSTFQVSTLSGGGAERTYVVTGTVYVMRASSRTVSTIRTTELRHSIVFKNNPAASRPIKKFWLFGNKAGIDFDVNGTTAANPITAPCATTCVAGEGSTVISTKSGALQFWTDGRTIWNRNGAQMPNGAGLNANGSTTQAAVVFPLTHDESRYGVVTNNTEAGVNDAGELYYSTIDMTLNAGLGDVVAKNIPLWGTTTDYSSEASTAAPKPDGSGYWILTFSPGGTDVRVFSYSIATQSITYVATYAGPGGIGRFYATQSGFGSLNFNSDYSQLLMMAGNHCVGACGGYYGMMRLMDFNTTTGAVTNRNMWNSHTNGTGYSADFSPSGAYVYSATLYNAYVARYTISGAPSDATIKASEAIIGISQPPTATSCTGGGQVLRAPNDKMYVANCGTGFLSVINTPDASSVGSIGWVYNGYTLAAGTLSYYGLPQMATIYSPYTTRY